VKYIIDAQLPKSICWIFNSRGLDTIHTDDLPDKARTTDDQIREISIREDRIVVTKDSDFINSHLIIGVPTKLLIITTGNISNNSLYNLLAKNIEQITELFEEHNLLELNNIEIIAHN